MLYPKNEKKFDPELFKNPTSEYRCTPFWAWNCELDRDELFYEIDRMKEMGMGGFHMHCRVGMSTKYLSDEFMALIKDCTEKAKKEKMLAWLYDEDKWPSGYAGGYVTERIEHRQKYLRFTPKRNEEGKAANSEKLEVDSGSTARISSIGDESMLIGMYDVELNTDGSLSSYRRLSDSEMGNNVWYAYLETVKPSPWFNFQTYVDTLSKPAIKEFVKTTHDRYKEVLFDDFGKSVPAIFTDEPQVTHKKCLDFATQKTDVILPFTIDFPESYLATYGEDILDKLPEIVWELPTGVSATRYHYHDHVTERFISAFCDTIGDWCQENGIYATGHMMEEPSLRSQTVAIGEAMRAYRSLTLPGVDMLCDYREYTTVKQAASATHQYGYPGVMSELYGVTNWDFDFRGHKLQGDWQAALGVSVRVPHLYWASMRGEAKRDYPASIGHQSAWYPEYPFIEDHFARVNTLMTRGKADIRIGVIHPIESYWLHYGPNDSTLGVRNEMDKRFFEITDWLLFDTLDFDYICESTLPIQYKESDKGFKVGEMSYDVVIVPACETLRSTTLNALKSFADKGGKVIFMGSAPTLVDAIPSTAPAALADKCIQIGWNRTALRAQLESHRTVKIQNMGGAQADNLLYALRNDGEQKHLFICHGKNCSRITTAPRESYKITLMGEYAPTLMDTETGDIRDIGATYENGNTLITWNCYSQSSLLLTLIPGRADASLSSTVGRAIYLPNGDILSNYRGECEIELDEPNVLVVDMAKWRLDDGEWQDEDDMLRICNKAKAQLGLSTATCHGAQPWVFSAPEPTNILTIESTVWSDVDVDNCELALESFEESEIWINGKPVKKENSGYYVDFAIKKTPIGSIKAGKTVITVKRPLGVVSNVENMFILGDFGVKVMGDSARITAPARKVRFGDLTRQGLAFYGGALTYKMKINGKRDLTVALGRFAATAIIASLDGQRLSNISLAPHAVDLCELSEGEHTLELKVYLSRINTFGSLHNANGDLRWFGPSGWYPIPEHYSYEYILSQTGILTAPFIIEK